MNTGTISTRLRGMTLGRRVVLTLAAVAMTVGLCAAPAAAYIRDFEDRSRESARNSLTQKLMSTACPPGKQAFGRGAGIIGGLDWGKAIQRLGSAIGATEPFQNDPNNWLLIAQSFCGSVTSTPPTMATRNTYLKDVEYKVASFPKQDATSPKEVVAGCPSGKTPIGGGFQATPPDGIIVRRAWHENARGWVVRAHGGRAPGTWHLSAWAICANTTGPPQTRPHDPLPRYVGSPTTVVNRSPQNSQPFNFIKARCPAGQLPIGGGAQVRAPGGGQPPPGVILSSSHPYYDPNPANQAGNGWWGLAREHAATSAIWVLEVTAICAPLVRHFP